MKFKIVSFSVWLCLILSSLVMSQSRSTGAIAGTITNDENVPLPRVTVTLTSDKLMRERSFVTDTSGNFRFPALPPGSYTLTAVLPGFSKYVQENIRLETTIRLTIGVKLTTATIEEQATVISQSPTVDIKSSEIASVTLSNKILRNIPFSNFAMDIVNMAPGVNDDVAYGASASTGVSYQIDGVDVSDSDQGSTWVFLDPDIIEEAKVMGPGLPAEYGNFTGVIFNLVTKSGGNEVSGHFSGTYQGKQDEWPKGLWQTDNNQDYLDDFPDMTSPVAVLQDYGIHLGGPIAKDKVWFYMGLQYFRSQYWETGFPNPRDYKQPRSFMKLTSQIGRSTNFTLWAEADYYNGINRSSGPSISPEATIKQESPEVVGSFSLTLIFNERTFFDIKGAFFWGYYHLDPMVGRDVSTHYDLNKNMKYDSAGWFYYADRNRYQANANITHYAEDFIGGDHDFKFGVEFEYAKTRNRYGYTGPDSIYYIDYVGYGYTGNYLAYQYEGYDSRTQYTRVEEFIQDSWKVSDRFNLNLGLRFTHVWGTVSGGDNPVYTNNAIAPRAGFTFDILGDRTTILKAHYGRFTEAMLAGYHDRLNPAAAYSDKTLWRWDPWDNNWVERYRIEHPDYIIDPDIKHPYMHQIVAGVERDLSHNMSLSAMFIYRNWKNIIGRVDTVGNYLPVDQYVPELDETFQIWERTDGSYYKYTLKNIQKGDSWISREPYRKYWGIELLFNKRFSNNWQLLASYVYSQATGTINNEIADDIGYGGSTDDPNFWINANGRSTNDPTHMLKIQGTVVLPFGIYLSTYFRAITGNTWTTRYWTGLLKQGRVTFLTEPRGTNRYPLEKTLDMRLEKTFTFAGKYRVGLMFDVFNVFNDNTINSWGTRIGYDWVLEGDPDYKASTEGHELYGFVRPRRARLGIRFMF